jgi:Ca2+-binding EF-hand superfamily protein
VMVTCRLILSKMCTIKAFYNMIGPTITHEEDEATPEEFTDKMFRIMDVNNNGKLSLEEFVEGAKLNKCLVQILQNK